ncbi:MAG: hypothetical protein IE885_08325 [Campylobacterales bacterium]|nr:hypothetical protein [Campylobacterales bacterium]
MDKMVWVLSFILIVGIEGINAAEKYDVKSFRILTKLCTKCHGTPFYMAKQIDEDDWDFFFENEEKMLKLHKDKSEGMNAFKSTLFQSYKEKLRKFLIDNSKYSGTVHGCDGNFCGTHH